MRRGASRQLVYGALAVVSVAVVTAAWRMQLTVDDQMPAAPVADVMREAPQAASPWSILARQQQGRPQDAAALPDDWDASSMEPMPPALPFVSPPVPAATGDPMQVALASAFASMAPVAATPGAAVSFDQVEVAQLTAAPIEPPSSTPIEVPAPTIVAPQPEAPAPITLAASAAPAAAIAAPARWISGGLKNSDNPRGLLVGTVAVRITVLANGRAGACRGTESNANTRLAEFTCRLVRPRLIFSPARDASGRPIESELDTTYAWGNRVRK